MIDSKDNSDRQGNLLYPANLGEFALSSCALGTACLIPAIFVTVVLIPNIRDITWAERFAPWDAFGLMGVGWLGLMRPIYRRLRAAAHTWRTTTTESRPLLYSETCTLAATVLVNLIAWADPAYLDVERGLRYLFSGGIAWLIGHHIAACVALRTSPIRRDLVLWLASLVACVWSWRDASV